jgi:hypothetical protein
MQNKKAGPVNIAEISLKGSLGNLFNKAKSINNINDKLLPLLPPSVASIKLSTVAETTATFIARDQSIAFRAKQQDKLILSSLIKLDELSHVKKINIKVDSR